MKRPRRRPINVREPQKADNSNAARISSFEVVGVRAGTVFSPLIGEHHAHGVYVNFAPVTDLATEPANSIVATCAAGDEPLTCKADAKWLLCLLGSHEG
jgi:hypothetical protein